MHSTKYYLIAIWCKSNSYKYMTSATTAQIQQWRTQIREARCAHQIKLSQSLHRLESTGDNKNVARFRQALEKSLSEVDHFKSRLEKISFTEELPICTRRAEIADLIRCHQVLIVAGETGSGKTTQLPKICLELGYGTRGLIGHTQPRRIAARTVADRIASELNSTVGETVGFQVRFNNKSGDNTQIKLMTDGILLAEIQADPLLSNYEVIIIDEAHERSLNIDFLLGLLKPLCTKRPDLKIIITSATIDLDKFSRHFSQNGTPAPVIEVTGRTYPVEVIYQVCEDGKNNLPDTICSTVDYIISCEAKGMFKARGDILVFCSGEREIRDVAQALRKSSLTISVLPLYSRLSVKEQNKVFQKSAFRKVVLATNVAETSLTVPGIAYVIDPGLARISRYSFKSKVQRLPIEEISQASANQRMGRCGRVANGVCIRLYSKENFQARDEFTPAEILRSNLASVILQMRRLKIRDIDHFDFIDRPDPRLLRDGIKLLQELEALDKDNQLTSVGKQLCVLPVDPKFARMLVSAHKLGCLRDTLIVISALSIQDPRERPAEHRQKADLKHNSLQHPQSDFYSFLYLWQSILTQRDELSSTKFKKLCVENFWSIARVFEWREHFRQLSSACNKLGWKTGAWIDLQLPETGKKTSPAKTKRQFDARYRNLHRALLTGLFGNIAMRDTEGVYLATRNRKPLIFPGSTLIRQKPKWIMAAEYLETSKLFLLTVAEIDPDWVIEAAVHLLKYNYNEPSYDVKSGQVKATRKTLFQGLVLRDKQRVDYATVNPDEARQLFIMQGLVSGRYQQKSKPLRLNLEKQQAPSKKGAKAKTKKSQETFTAHNRKLINSVKKLEIKTRRKDLLVDEQSIFNFYDKHLPPDVVCRATFEKWYKTAVKDKPKLLYLERENLLLKSIQDNSVAQFPEHIVIQGKKIKLLYTFDPASDTDGISMLIPHALLAHFPEHIGSWLVPGLLREKCIALVKSLPKSMRRNFVPVSDAIDLVLPLLSESGDSLEIQLGHQLFRQFGTKVEVDAWYLQKLDTYYHMNYRVISDDGSLLAESRDLSKLKSAYSDSLMQEAQNSESPKRHQFERTSLVTWDFDDLPETFSYQHQGMQVTVFPMLYLEQNNKVSLTVSHNKDLANYYSSRAIVRLAQSELAATSANQTIRYLQKELFKTSSPNATKHSNSLAKQLESIKHYTDERAIWKNDIIDSALHESCFASATGIPRTRIAFDDALKHARQWVTNALELETALSAALDKRDELITSLNTFKASSQEKKEALVDIRTQLKTMFEPGFLWYTSTAQLRQYPRYLRALSIRLDKLKNANFSIDSQNALLAMQSDFDQLVEEQISGLNTINYGNSELFIGALYFIRPDFLNFSIMLQEWRVSLFAQQLRTPIPVSEKRLRKAFKSLL